jgi:hypothetical protein
MDIMHRFGLWNKGYEDFWGFLLHQTSGLDLAMYLLPD